MGGFLALAIILGAVAALVLWGGDETIAGFRADQLASLAWVSAVGIVVLGWVVSHFRGQWSRALGALAFWLAMVVGLVALYTYRFEITTVASRMVSEVSPGTTVTGASGEVSITRRLDGDFIVSGEVNGRTARFIFDTGASTIVLTAEAARRIGLDPGRLDYSEMVMTANGRTLAAAVLLDSVAVGGIVEHRVSALVARPGTLFENLLGRTFLDRLASYEVRGNRLYLRGRGLKTSVREHVNG